MVYSLIDELKLALSFKNEPASRSLKSDYKYENKICKMIKSDFGGRVTLFGEWEIMFQFRF